MFDLENLGQSGFILLVLAKVYSSAWHIAVKNKAQVAKEARKKCLEQSFNLTFLIFDLVKCGYSLVEHLGMRKS